MSWQDRLTLARIITGDNKEFVIELKEVSKARVDRAVVFSYSEFSGDFVQKLSAGGNGFSFTFWFSGADHDIIANSFEESSKDIRPVLFYMPLEKQPFKCQIISLKKIRNLVDDNNRTPFKIEMHETLSGKQIESIENSIAKVNNISIEAADSASNSYRIGVEVKAINQTGEGGQTTFVPFGVNDSIFPINETKNELDSIVAKVAEKINIFYLNATEFLAEAESIRYSALNLISTLESAPKAVSLVVRGYTGFVGKTILNPEILKPKSKVGFFNDLKQDLVINDITNYELIFPSVIVGLCQSVLVANVDDFSTRSEVYEIIDNIFDWSLEFFAKIDSVIIDDELNNYEPNLDSIKQMLSIVSITASKLETLIFQLKQERSITVNKIRDFHTLVYELLGAESMDELELKVKNFMLINNIRGTNVFMAEPGQEYIYYT